MTITPELIYGITRLDAAHSVLTAITALAVLVGLLCLLGVVVCTIERLTSGDDAYNIGVFKLAARWLLISSLVLVCVVTAKVCLPTTNEMAMIYVVPKIVNANFVQEDLPKDAREIYDLAKQAVVKQLTGEEKK